MNTWHIHIEGQVQGVGFRPYVFLLAKSYGLSGWVNNTTDGVHIEFNGEDRIAYTFYEELISRAPALSQITSHRISTVADKNFDQFQIKHSTGEAKAKLLLTPDFAICSDCREELAQIGNRRMAYPFITCTNCGPRYSIIHQLPYDRINTRMDSFQMCPTCKTEYENPSDRRYYSQTNSCPKCQIELSFFDGKGNEIRETQEVIIDSVVRSWQEGKLVAIKGIGGYLLTCDAENKAAVQALRVKKHRPSKPLALMYPNLESLNDYSFREEEIQALNHYSAPIVLLNLKEVAEAENAIAPGLNQIGVLLPYAPLYELLLQKFGKPIVATSGNISNSPIVYQDDRALQELPQIADFILTNNRDIVVPQDDSVLKYTFFGGRKIIIRRARGLAPTYINANLAWPSQSILATGAMLKSTFSFLHQGNSYISQYLGDLDHFDTQQVYQETIQHFLQLFDAQPEVILCDKHPDYATSKHGEQLAKELGLPLQKIQHHIAHFGAILGENNLLHSEEAILGVIWDGTGLGNDQQIWGGEFFKYEAYDFLRAYHFDYFDFILGDKMPKEPRIAALAACWDVMGAEELLIDKFSEVEWQVYAKLLDKGASLQTSSLGRIFDAVASLLGIMDKQSYEGEAAMRLEAMATSYFKENGLNFPSSYFQEGAHYYRIPTKSLMTNIVMDLRKGKSQAFIAAKFHFSLAKLIKIVANNLNIRKVACSGGVFQNGLLVDLIVYHLEDDFELYFHQELSPNDENISFGQLVCHQIDQHKGATKNKMVISDELFCVQARRENQA